MSLRSKEEGEGTISERQQSESRLIWRCCASDSFCADKQMSRFGSRELLCNAIAATERPTLVFGQRGDHRL